jgi:hypothetical protein
MKNVTNFLLPFKMITYRLKNDHAASVGHVREAHTLLTSKIDALTLDQIQRPVANINMGNYHLENLSAPVFDSDSARLYDVNLERDRALLVE